MGPWSCGGGRTTQPPGSPRRSTTSPRPGTPPAAAGDRRLEMIVLRELAGDVPVALGRPPADCEPALAECLRLAGALGDRGMEADVLGRLTVLRSSQLDFTAAR